MALLTENTMTKVFAGTGTSDVLLCIGSCGATLDFGAGSTVAIQGSYDNSTFFNLKLPDGSTDASYTADAIVELFFNMPTFVRFNCSVYSSGVTCVLNRLGNQSRLGAS